MIEKFVENTVNTEEGQFRRLIFGIRLRDGSVTPVKGKNFRGEMVTFTYEKLINGVWIEVSKPKYFIPKTSKVEDLIKTYNPDHFELLEIGKKLRKCC
jgi:hypothetical protein